jgi:hypothetical protein
LALQIDPHGVDHEPRRPRMRCSGLRTIVRCGSHPTSPTQFALAGLGTVGAAIRLRQLRSIRFRWIGPPYHYGVPALPRARILSIRCEGALRTFFGHRRLLTPRASYGWRSLYRNPFRPLTSYVASRAPPVVGSSRSAAFVSDGPRFREGDAGTISLTRLARTASDASGKGDAEHDPERLPSSQLSHKPSPAGLPLACCP